MGQYRNQGQVRLDGAVRGIAYNRRVARAAPVEDPAIRGQSRAAPPYMSLHPDAYEPHAGESAFFEPGYSPYQAELPTPAIEELHWPTPQFAPLPDQIEYGNLPMTNGIFKQLMENLGGPDEILDPIPFENDVMADLSAGAPEPFPDGIAQDEPEDNLAMLFNDADMGVAADHAGGPVGYHAAPMETGPLEQIVEELAPAPEIPPDELQYGPFPTEEQMMPDPWMMPGM